MAKQKSNTQKTRVMADALLFAEAKAHIEDILDLVDQYNEIAEELTEMGYGGDTMDDGDPIPTLQVIGCGIGNFTFDSPEILDPFWEQGPMRAKVPSPTKRQLVVSKERHRLGKESNWTCFYCRHEGSEQFGPDERVWHVDHVYPIVRGGDDLPDNHVLACATCNLSKRARTALEYFAGERKSRIFAVTEQP